MNKARLEALSDGVFAIVLTLLVFDIKIPEGTGDNFESLVQALHQVAPTLLEYFVSFVILTMFWIGHNFMYSVFARTIDRVMIILNLLYLALISLIPFSARLLEQYRDIPLAVVIYGLNIFLIGIVNIIIVQYALSSDDIDTAETTPRLLKQARIRQIVTPLFTLVGMLLSFVSIQAAYFMYALPIIFNVVPGSLNFIERLFGFKLE